jgi:aspartate carbamoyltransferase regulatory subunit
VWSSMKEERIAKAPQTTIEAVVHSVRERGIAALKEPENIERLLRCDNAARSEINERIARLIAAKEIAA